MFFSFDYDKSLWLILAGDSSNKEMILEFISSIPSEFYNKIKKGLKEYCASKRYSLGDILRLDNGYVYTYSINAETSSFCICRALVVDGEYQDVFMLSLFPYDVTTIKNFCSFDIGCFLYKIKTDDGYDRCDKIQYSLFKMPFGLVLRKFFEYNLVYRNEFKKFDDELINNIGDDSNLFVKRKKDRGV